MDGDAAGPGLGGPVPLVPPEPHRDSAAARHTRDTHGQSRGSPAPGKVLPPLLNCGPICRIGMGVCAPVQLREGTSRRERNNLG